jgi:catechol 2,3-dioxygenase-like lactoylglutathione lyase family enzyme
MLHVANVGTSISFYEELGFRVMNLHPGPGEGPVTWAWLESDAAQIMLTLASEPVVPERQGVVFYFYCDDVLAAKAALEEAGIATGEIASPFYSPQGEFRIADPDGYTVMITHT